MSQNAKKEIQEIIRKLKQHGVEVEQLQNGHWRTKTTPPITMSNSPSDTNAARAATRDIRKYLGIDIRLNPQRKDSTNDFAMNRLRERALRQMERGATVADLARMAVAESEDKRIGGWTTTNAAEVGISNTLRGGRLVKQNHDTLAAALGKLESASDKDFLPKHLDKAAERFGKRRIAHKAEPSAPESAPEPDPAAEVRAENDARLETAEAELRERQSGPVPGKIEVTVKIELGEETLRLIEKLLAR